MFTINLYLSFRQADYLHSSLYIFDLKLDEEIDLLFKIANHLSFFNNKSRDSNKNLLLLLLLSLLIYASSNVRLSSFTLGSAASFVKNISVIFLESKTAFG